MVLRAKDTNLLGTQKTVLMEFVEGVTKTRNGKRNGKKNGIKRKAKVSKEYEKYALILKMKKCHTCTYWF